MGIQRVKCLLISWLQSPSAAILEPKKIKSDTVSPSISHEITQLVKNLPAMWETKVQSLGWEDPLAGGPWSIGS